MSLSTAQIAAQLDRVLSNDPTALAVAIRAATRQPWPEALMQHGRQFRVRWCDSSLAIREALCEAEQQDGATSGLVVITPLSTPQVADDIAARLARARVFQPDGWDMVRQLFQAKETDARLGRFAWMPQALIDGAAQGAYPPVANGFLDLDTAWREVMQRFLGIDAARPDMVALLRWSMAADAGVKLALLPAAAQADVMRWLGESSGSGGDPVLACVEAGRTNDALPLGLVCGIVFAAEGEGQAELGMAAVRLERFVGGRPVGIAEGRAWSRASEAVVRSIAPEAARMFLDRAEALLRELLVARFARLSDLLPASLDQRLEDFARALAAHVVQPSEPPLRQVELQADRALRHGLMSEQKARGERVEMARRLARWLALPGPAPTSMQAAVAWQVDQGAFVDWARFRLLGGDELPELSQAYGACRDAVIARRDAFAGSFGQALVQWNAQTPRAEGRVVPVEAVLEKVLAPIAAAQPVLLLVMDGLTASIFRELFARIAAQGWAEMVPADLGWPLAGVAALPTITEVSRASLLCGRLTVGAAPQEKKGFATHPALLACSRPEAPPRLFHKGELAEATNLAPEVRAAIASTQQRVVGVVYNAVDDHLSGPDQLHQRWAIEDLRLLLPLLREAREARRVVVITADHGHLLEDGTTQLPGGASDRWRPGQSAASPHELALSGGRITTGDGSNAVVCLWGERTRYAGRKNGYHGGVSPQEVIVPLSVIVPLGLNLPGWNPAPPAQPEWWEMPLPLQAVVPPVTPAPAARSSRRKPVESAAGQPELFAPIDLPTATAVDAAKSAATAAVAVGGGSAVDAWIEALLRSPVYASQRQLAARVAPPDEQMRLLLSAFAERGGKLSKPALAHRLALPEVRIGGLLSAARRLLNVDQAAVLTVDETTAAVELNIALLQQQFGMPRQGSLR